MAAPILLCTDGSDLSLDALRAGHALLDADTPRIVVTVTNLPDEAEMVGAGHVGPTLTREQFDAERDEKRRAAEEALAEADATIGGPARHEVLDSGHPGRAIVDLAEREGAAAIVIGSRGRGGLKRAALGSVSDHIVRHAPCPVLVHPATASDG